MILSFSKTDINITRAGVYRKPALVQCAYAAVKCELPK